MRKLFKAAMIVTIFSVLTRALGFVLKIILSRCLGAEMLGNYQVAMSIFGVLMTLVASGIPLIVSRTVAFKKSEGDSRGAYSSVSAGLIIATGISLAVSLVLFLFPNSLNFLFSNYSQNILLFSLPGLVMSAIYCVLRSSLWGDKRFFAISFTEFFEQVVRIILCLILFTPAILPGLDYGSKAALSLSLACVASTALVVIIYFALKNKLKSPKGAFKPLLKSATPITAVRTVSSLVSSLIAIIIPLRLTLYGYTKSQAMAEFGMVMGMAFPLIMIPGTLISSLAVTLVPEISSKTDNIDDKSKVHDLSGLKGHIRLGLNMSTIIGMVCFPAFLVLGRPICQILFGSAEAGKYVSAAAILMLPQGISQISSSMLNSMGLEMKSLINYAIGASFLLVSIFFLPKFVGTYALVIGMVGLSTITCLLNLRMLYRRGLVHRGYPAFVLKTLAFGVISSLATKLCYDLLIRFTPLFVATIIAGIISLAFIIGLYLAFDMAGIRTMFVKKSKASSLKKA